MAVLSSIHEVYPSARRATVPLGIRVDDMIVANGLNGCDPVTSEVSGDLEAQFAAALGKMRSVVEGGGGSLANVGRAVAYVTRLEDRPPVNGPWWQALFPDATDRPAYKVLLADLPPGQLVRLDMMALWGGTRRRIDIPNVSAFDPTVVIGNMVISSRCHGNDKNNDGKLVSGGLPAEARQTFRNLRELVSIAGGSAGDIVQINTYAREDGYQTEARTAFDEVFSDVDRKPKLNTLVNFVTETMQIAADMVAVMANGR